MTLTTLAKGRTQFLSRFIHTAAVANMPIKVGEKLPSVEVYEGDPGTKLSMADLFKGKKGILFAVPGAFTPGCSKVRMLADPTGAFTQAVDLMLDNDHLLEVLGNKRSQRYAMLVQDGVVKKLNVEPDGHGLTCSLSSSMLSLV